MAVRHGPLGAILVEQLKNVPLAFYRIFKNEVVSGTSVAKVRTCWHGSGIAPTFDIGEEGGNAVMRRSGTLPHH